MREMTTGKRATTYATLQVAMMDAATITIKTITAPATAPPTTAATAGERERERERDREIERREIERGRGRGRGREREREREVEAYPRREGQLPTSSASWCVSAPLPTVQAQQLASPLQGVAAATGHAHPHPGVGQGGVEGGVAHREGGAHL